MLNYSNSDVFSYYNKGNGITKKLMSSLTRIGEYNISTQLDRHYTTILRSYKEVIGNRAVGAIRKGHIMIVRLPITDTGDLRFPEIIPFVKVRNAKNKDMAVIDISRYSTEVLDKNGKVIDYKIDIPRFYVTIVSAYMSLQLSSPGITLPAEAQKTMSAIFAKMFNQVLYRIGLLSNDKERYMAFVYFTMQFYMRYYLESPPEIANSVAMGYIGNQKNALIEYMEGQIKHLGIEPFKDFRTYMTTIFNNEVTGFRTTVSNNSTINSSYFFQRYITMYSKSAVSGLWAADYFFYVLMSAYRKTNVVFDRAFEDIFRDDPRAMPKLMDSIYKEI